MKLAHSRLENQLAQLSGRYRSDSSIPPVSHRSQMECSQSQREASSSLRSAVDSIPVAPTTDGPATRLIGLSGKPIGGQYANQAIRTLRVMLNKAKEWKLIAEVPTLKLRKAAGRQLLFSAEDEAGILKHASQDVGDVFVQVQDTGMRPNEVFRTQWPDVFFNEDYIFVPESKTEAGRRKVPMSARLKQRLWERRKKSKTIWVYPARRGEGHLQSIAVGFRNARRKAGVDSRKVLYTARHTFGTYTLAASQNLPAVMKTMGHASVNSTLPYQHHGMESIRAAIDARNQVSPAQAEPKERSA